MLHPIVGNSDMTDVSHKAKAQKEENARMIVLENIAVMNSEL